MRVERRGFLKLLGGTAAAAVAAPILAPSFGPLFIPSERLDMGVPRRILTATELPATLQSPGEAWGDPAPMPGPRVPMLLVQDEFMPPGWRQFGRKRVPAGTTLYVDRETAERWAERGVGTPGPGAPAEMQAAAARRVAERHATTMQWTNTSIGAGDIRSIEPISQQIVDDRDRRWSAGIERAVARVRRAVRTPEMAWWDDGA